MSNHRWRIVVLPGLLLCCALARLTAPPPAFGAPEAPGPTTAPRPLLPQAEAFLTTDVALLALHGIAAGPARAGMLPLTRFLDEGLPQGTDLAGPPELPAARAQLLVSAMRVAALRRDAGAAPAIARYVGGPLPPGAERLIEHDARGAPPAQQERRREAIRALLRDNAINALGLIGSTKSWLVLSRAFDDEPDAARRIPIALALACAGDRERIGLLVEQAASDERRVAAAAIGALELVTGQQYGITLNSSYARRQEAAARVKQWWKKEGRKFTPDSEAIFQRRLTARPSALPVPPRSFYDWVTLAADPANLDGEFSNWNAREAILAMGASAVAPLEAIVLDDKEDINARVFAIRTYTTLTRDTARPRLLQTLKKVRRDRDPEVRELATRIVADFEGGN